MPEIAEIRGAIEFVFSAVFLIPIAVIFGGKLIALRYPLKIPSEENVLKVNLLILKTRSTGAEVAWGFLAFIFCIAASIVIFGESTQIFLQSRAGIDLGIWTSHCVVAALFTLVLAFLIFLLVPVLRQSPLLSENERELQVEKLTNGE